jgi:hypothetical protein
VHHTHFHDLNAAELDLNSPSSNILEQRIDLLTLDKLDEFLRLIQNYLHETIDVGRGTNRGICSHISCPQITACDVLIRIPRQPGAYQYHIDPRTHSAVPG